MLSMIVELIPRNVNLLMNTKPATLTLGAKKLCSPIVESCAIVTPKFTRTLF